MKLRYEIEEDLAAGRIEQHDYDFCKQQIETNLRALDEPLPPGQRIRVVGIPRKKIDVDKLAAAVLMQAENELRRKQGRSPVSESDVKEFIADVTLARIRRQEIERKEADKQQQAARRRFERNKPAALRQATWDWLLARGLQDLPPDGRLGRLVYELGILAQPELLRSTVIRADDGLDYVIDRQSATDLVGDGDTISLVRLHDRERVSTSRDKVVAAIAEGEVFDQLDI
jgi:hypothetical protein